MNLPYILRKICQNRGISVELSPHAPFLVADNGTGQYIMKWDAATLGAAPTVEEISAIDPVAIQNELAAEESAETERQAFLRQIKSFYQNEFVPLRAWARTKGYPG